MRVQSIKRIVEFPVDRSSKQFEKGSSFGGQGFRAKIAVMLLYGREIAIAAPTIGALAKYWNSLGGKRLDRSQIQSVLILPDREAS